MKRSTILITLLFAGYGLTALAQDPNIDTIQQKMERDRIDADVDRMRTEQDLDVTRKKIAETQQRMEELARDMSRYSKEMVMRNPEVYRWVGRANGSGAMLGVHIENAETKDGKALDAVEIEQVHPDGPAEKAGLKTGDRITALNDTALKWNGTTSPTQTMLEYMSNAKPGDVVKVSFERDGKKQKLDVTATKFDLKRYFVFDRDGDHDFDINIDIPDVPIPPVIDFQFRSWHNLELVQVTPKLGSYFNTEKGLLVVRAGDNKAMDIQEGDVILNIDGREPEDPTHAMRILGSYRAGETVKIDIMRDRKKKTVEFEVKQPQRNISFRNINHSTTR